MILFLFSALLIILCVLSIAKKRFLELFFPMLLFLPDYYGFEFSAGLPILTVKRILFLILFVYAFLNRDHQKTFRELLRITPVSLLFFLYFVFRISSNLYYITTYGQASKTILSLIFEQFMLVIALRLLSPTEKECVSIVRAIVWSAAVMFLLGIIESFTGYRISDSLYTVNRYMLNEYYVRSGLLRATVTLGLPTFYGNACVLMMPFIMFLYEYTKKWIYLPIGGLCVYACIHSGSRASFLFILATLFFCLLLLIRDIKRFLSYIKHVLAVGAVLIILISSLSLANQKCRAYYLGYGKSVLNTLGFDFKLDYDDDNGVSTEFGKNKPGVMSRTAQFSGIPYVARINPVFGLGSGAQTRGDIRYYWDKNWHLVYSYDVGYVEVFGDEGALGWIGYYALFLSAALFILFKENKDKHLRLCHYLVLGMAAYLLCMLSTANMSMFLFTFFSLLFVKPDCAPEGQE